QEWQTFVQQQADATLASLNNQVLTPTTTLTHHGYYAYAPQPSPDGKYVAYVGGDGNTTSAIHVIDLATCKDSVVDKQSASDTPSWLPNNELLISRLDFTDPYHLYADAYVVTPNGDRKLTHCARIQRSGAGRAG